MNILAHRGYWNSYLNKNSLPAFEAAVQRHFGFESDLRDYRGSLVIAHDMANSSSLKAETVFQLLARQREPRCFAINIKADGLQGPLKLLLEKYRIENYFAFDMSVPQMLEYRAQGIRFFTRQSEVEPSPCLYEAAAGVWIDAFDDERWITEELLRGHLANGRAVCLVSPELHQREEREFWRRLRSFRIAGDAVFLCTDKPSEAAAYFEAGRGGDEDENQSGDF